MNRKYIVIIVTVIVLAGIFFVLNNNSTGNIVKNNPEFQSEGKSEEGITEGKLAKDFSLTTIDGNVVKLSDFKGKYVLFAAMATWCVPCQIEADNVRRVQENFEHIPLVVMQIDVDTRETKQDLIRFRNEFGKEDWIMGFDDDGSITQLYNIRTFDTTLVINPEGKIIYRDNGFPIDTKTLEDLIVKGESTNLVLGSTHEHADIKVTLGDEVDFSKDKYQLRSSFVHFEGGDGKEVHVHAKGVTLQYLFETLGWEIDNGCVVTDLGEYCNVEVTVNGKKADIEHEIKDNEIIMVESK